MINLSHNLEFWMTEVAQCLTDAGYRVGVVIVQDQDPTLRREKYHGGFHRSDAFEPR